MITRRHSDGDTHSLARYSECETYRYLLQRQWADAPRVVFVMLNPSTASELANDPTVERCERRARMMGFGGISVVNLFAFRATDPRDLKAAKAPIGPDNDAIVLETCAEAGMIIAGWGAHGGHLNRSTEMRTALAKAGHMLHHLGQTKAGEPRHPLYVAYRQLPESWTSCRHIPPPPKSSN